MNYKVKDCYFASVLRRIHVKIVFLIGHMFTYSIKVTWKDKFRAAITRYFLLKKWRIRILRSESFPFQIICSHPKSEKQKKTKDIGHAAPINLGSLIYGWACFIIIIVVSNIWKDWELTPTLSTNKQMEKQREMEWHVPV